MPPTYVTNKSWCQIRFGLVAEGSVLWGGGANNSETNTLKIILGNQVTTGDHLTNRDPRKRETQ